MEKPSTDLVPVGRYPDLDEAHELELREEAEMAGEGEVPALLDDDARLAAAADDQQGAAPDEDDADSLPAARTGPGADDDDTPQTQLAPLPKGAVPFSLKADGSEVAVPGAFRQKGYVVIPEAAWQGTVQKHLADRTKWQQQQAQMQGQLRQAVTAYKDLEAAIPRHPMVVQAMAMLAEFHALLEKGPDAVDEWLLDFEKNREKLLRDMEARAEQDRRQAELDAREARQRREQEEQRLAALPAMLDDLVRRNLAYYAAQAGYEGLKTPAVMARIEEEFRAAEFRQAMFIEATEDSATMKRGQIDVNRGYFERLLKTQLAALVKTDKQRKAEEFNAAALRQGRQPNPTPPAPQRSGRTPAPEGRGGNRPVDPNAPTSFEEWGEQFTRGRK